MLRAETQRELADQLARSTCEEPEIRPDRNTVHSWNARIHPQVFYPLAARSDTNRWGSVDLADPRYPHFRACGDYAPGEIAWSLFDATIELHGRAYWGPERLVFLDWLGIHRLTGEFGISSRVIDQRGDIGLPGQSDG